MAILLAPLGLALLAPAGRAQPTSDEEVPFITTPDRVTLAMLQLAGMGPGDVLVDLGSGTGRMLTLLGRPTTVRLLPPERLRPLPLPAKLEMAALETRIVERNPRLVNMWAHLSNEVFVDDAGCRGRLALG